MRVCVGCVATEPSLWRLTQRRHPQDGRASPKALVPLEVAPDSSLKACVCAAESSCESPLSFVRAACCWVDPHHHIQKYLSQKKTVDSGSQTMTCLRWSLLQPMGTINEKYSVCSYLADLYCCSLWRGNSSWCSVPEINLFSGKIVKLRMWAPAPSLPPLQRLVGGGFGTS